MRNTRINYLVSYGGETKCVAEWAERYGVRSELVYTRLVKLGWTFEEAVGLCRHITRSRGDSFYRVPYVERGLAVAGGVGDPEAGCCGQG